MPFIIESKMTFKYLKDRLIRAEFINYNKMKKGGVTIARDKVNLGNKTKLENK